MQLDLDETLVRLSLSQSEIEAFCQRWQVSELALFGSVLREDFPPDSDVDVLVEFQPTAPKGLSEWIAMQDELEFLFGRQVDLVSKRAIQESHNWIRKRNILTQSASHLWRQLIVMGKLFSILSMQLNKFKQSYNRASLEAFKSNREKQAAVLYFCITIGEATKRISQAMRTQYPDIPWREMAGLRDILAHQYDRVDLETIWNITQTSIPALLSRLDPLLPSE